MPDPTIKTSNVFLDTEVFVQANFDYNSARFKSVGDLAREGRIRVFLTELTVREIKANLDEAVQRAAGTRPHAVLRNSKLPAIQALFEPLDTKAVEKELIGQLEDFIKEARVNVLTVKQELMAPVLDNYFNRLPPFGAGKNKAEFPDAFVLETLKEWCGETERGMAVVTRDGGMKSACSDTGPLFHFEDLPKYLNEVSSENRVLSEFIREMVPHHDEEVFARAKAAFGDHGFYLTDQDGDVGEVELGEIEYDGEIGIILLQDDHAIIEMPATLSFTADVTYDVPGTGIYDKEDDVILFQDIADATVERTAHRSVAVEVTFEDLNPDSFDVINVWVEGPEVGVRSDYDEDWPYK